MQTSLKMSTSSPQMLLVIMLSYLAGRAKTVQNKLITRVKHALLALLPSHDFLHKLLAVVAKTSGCRSYMPLDFDSQAEERAHAHPQRSMQYPCSDPRLSHACLPTSAHSENTNHCTRRHTPPCFRPGLGSVVTDAYKRCPCHSDCSGLHHFNQSSWEKAISGFGRHQRGPCCRLTGASSSINSIPRDMGLAKRV